MLIDMNMKMFREDDFEIEDFGDFLAFLPVVFFLGLVGPFLLAGYGIGFALNAIGLYD